MLHISEKVQPARPRGGCWYKSSAGQRAARRLRKSYLRKIRSREYKRLQAIVPSVSKREKIGKVTVIEEAIKYIDELHSALAQRLGLCPGTAPSDLNCMTLLKLVSPYVGSMTTGGATLPQGTPASSSAVAVGKPLAEKDIGSRMAVPTADHRLGEMCNTGSQWEMNRLQQKLRL